MSNFPAKDKSTRRAFYRDGVKKLNVDNDQVYREAAAAIAAFVRRYWLEKGYSPSIDEIGNECGYHRTTAYYWVHRMREKGDLLFEDKVARSIRLPGQTVNFSGQHNTGSG